MSARWIEEGVKILVKVSSFTAAHRLLFTATWMLEGPERLDLQAMPPSLDDFILMKAK